MQLASTTDYAIRIVCYLAAQRQMISTSELSQELSVPSSYIPKITKKLKQAGIIKACEGTNGGYIAYSARTAHPFRRNGAPFRFKLSKAQQVD